MKKSLWKQKLQLHALTSAWVDQVDAMDESEFYVKFKQQDLSVTSEPVVLTVETATQRKKTLTQPMQLRDILVKSIPSNQVVHLQLLDLLNVRSSAYSQLHGLSLEEEEKTMLAGKATGGKAGKARDKGRGRNVVTVEEEEEQELAAQPSTVKPSMSPVWKCMLSDGYTTIPAMSLDGIPGLAAEVLLGAKLLVQLDTPLAHGVLLLSAKNTQVVGGFVEAWRGWTYENRLKRLLKMDVISSLAHASSTQMEAAAPVAVNRPALAPRPAVVAPPPRPPPPSVISNDSNTSIHQRKPAPAPVASVTRGPLSNPLAHGQEAQPGQHIPTRPVHNVTLIQPTQNAAAPAAPVSSTPKRSFRDRLVNYDSGSSVHARVPLFGSTPIVSARSSGTQGSGNLVDGVNGNDNGDDDDDLWGLDSSPPIQRHKKAARSLSLRSTSKKPDKENISAGDMTSSAEDMARSQSLDTNNGIVIHIDDDADTSANFDFFTIPMDVDVVAVADEREPGRILSDLYNLPRNGVANVKALFLSLEGQLQFQHGNYQARAKITDGITSFSVQLRPELLAKWIGMSAQDLQRSLKTKDVVVLRDIQKRIEKVESQFMAAEGIFQLDTAHEPPQLLSITPITGNDAHTSWMYSL